MTLPSTGDVIGGKYRVGHAIADGGMGVVYDGVHVQLEDPIAIKILKPDVAGAAGEEAVKRFMREARTCIKIRSEHVVRVIDVDTLPGGVPYMVMERLTGRDLDAIVEVSGPLPPSDAVDYVLQALEAVAEAHALGIVHRDLKPANLFLTQRADGSPCIKVLDFGISKIESAHDGGMTQTQAVMGSPRYMSPEQLRASRDVDARTDIWAVGVVLYELLTGRPPFDGASMTQIAAQILENVPAPMALRSDHAAAVEAIVLRCLSKRAADRFANVAELAAALAPLGSPSAATSASRIHGVLNRGAVTALSHPSLPALASAPPRAASGTDVAWGDVRSSSVANRRLGLYAGGAALLALVGVVLLVIAFRRGRADPPTAAAAPPPVMTVAAPVAPATALATAEPAPTAATLASVTSPPEPVPHPVATARPTPSAQRPAPKPRPTSAPTSSSAAAPVSTTWSDRK